MLQAAVARPDGYAALPKHVQSHPELKSNDEFVLYMQAAGARPDGYAVLPGDVEAAAAAAASEQGRTWTVLFLDACK
jgi:hypothetical protein